jgi:hypothetical protein
MLGIVGAAPEPIAFDAQVLIDDQPLAQIFGLKIMDVNPTKTLVCEALGREIAKSTVADSFSSGSPSAESSANRSSTSRKPL